MNRISIITTLAAVALLAAGAAQAATKEDVAKARAECASQKARVAQMEGKMARGEGLSKAKLEWEAACQHAEVLINEMNGTKPPAVVPPTNS